MARGIPQSDGTPGPLSDQGWHLHASRGAVILAYWLLWSEPQQETLAVRRVQGVQIRRSRVHHPEQPHRTL